MVDQVSHGGCGFFEITDHTTASDWERLIANIEEVLTDWKLNRETSKDKPYHELESGVISNGIWHEKVESIRHRDTTFDVRFLYLGENEKTSKPVEQANSIDCDEKKPHPGDTRESSPDSLEFEDAKNEKSSSEEEDSGSESETDSFQFEDNAKLAVALKEQEEREHGEYELPERVPECLRDLMTTTNDFASKAHCLVRWYNLRKFIILTPKGDTIISEDRVKLMLSSLSIVLSEIDCHVPIFLQIRNPRSNFYQGISEHLNIRTMYEMIYLRKGLQQYSHMSDLISLFREKAGCTLNDPIKVTLRLNYCLDFFDLFLAPSEQFDGNEYNQDNQDELIKMTKEKKPAAKMMQDMRTGATFDKVVEALDDCLPHPYKILRFFHLAALWPPMSDKVITDSQVHSDLDAAEAPIWIVRGLTSDNCNMKIVHETQAFYGLLCGAVDYAYDKLDADVVFASDCDNRESLKGKCLQLCYELSTKPEVLLSNKPSDSIRKLIALLFYRAAEISEEESNALNEIAGHLKKKPSLSEIYRNFSRCHKPSVKEFIIRTQISRPFNPISTPALPQRMFCTICDEEFRLCGAFSELCN